MSKTLLCKEGYLIPKIDKYKSIIELVKKELTVEPFKFGVNFGAKVEENLFFKVYREDEKYLYIVIDANKHRKIITFYC